MQSPNLMHRHRSLNHKFSDRYIAADHIQHLTLIYSHLSPYVILKDCWPHPTTNADTPAFFHPMTTRKIDAPRIRICSSQRWYNCICLLATFFMADALLSTESSTLICLHPYHPYQASAFMCDLVAWIPRFVSYTKGNCTKGEASSSLVSTLTKTAPTLNV